MAQNIRRFSASTDYLFIVLASIVIFGLAAVALMADYIFSLITVLIIVIALLILDKKGVIANLFAIYIRRKKFAFLMTLVMMLIMPIILNTAGLYILRIAILACLYGVVALGLNFQMGSADMTNFAAAAFFGIGAYATGLISVKWGLNPWLGIPFAAVCALILGFAIGFPALRTKGYYLSLVTMALQLVFTLALTNIDYVGGPDGITGLTAYNLFGLDFGTAHTIFGIKLNANVLYLYLAMLVLLLAMYIAMRVNISRQGLALNNIAQDETAAKCLGVNLFGKKMFAFCLGAVFCGVVGAIYGQFMMFVAPDDFDFNKSLIFICMVILGGMDNPVGVLVGAFLMTVINEKLRDFADYQMLFYGVILMTVLIARPMGLISRRVRNYCDNYKLNIKKHVPEGELEKES